MYTNPWLFEGKIFDSDDISTYFGFVYCITNTLNNKQYIGRKYFWSSRKQPGKKRRTKKESDWKTYYGSSDDLKRDIELFGVEHFRREIVSLHKTKGDTNYSETKLQFELDVLEALTEDGERAYYNNNIMNRYFAPLNSHYEKTEEHKRKISETLKRKGVRPKTCDLPLTEEQKKKISETLKTRSHFVTDNPNDSIVYEVEFSDGRIEQIQNFHQWCEDNDVKFDNVRQWSKRQVRLNFGGKVKKTTYHKKYGIRLLGWKNVKTGQVEHFFEECSLQ